MVLFYKNQSLDNIGCKNSYEEIDTRLASGWYVDSVGKNKKKRYKTDKILDKKEYKKRYFFQIL